MSRGGSNRGDRGETDLTQRLAPRSPGVIHLARSSSAKPADRRPGVRLETDPRLASGLGRVRKSIFLRDRKNLRLVKTRQRRKLFLWQAKNLKIAGSASN